MAFIALNGSLGPHLTNNLKKNNCPSFLSVAMMNTMIKKKKNFGKKGFCCFALVFSSYSLQSTGKSGQEYRGRN